MSKAYSDEFADMASASVPLRFDASDTARNVAVYSGR